MQELRLNRKETIMKIWEAERRFDLFSYKCRKIPLWIYPRIKASNMINGVNDLGGQTDGFIKINFLNILQRLFYFFLKLPQLFGNDVIVFSNERYLDMDKKSGKYFNSMAEAAIVDSHAKEPLIFEFPSSTTLKYKETKYKSYVPMDLFLAIKEAFLFLAFFYRPKIKKEFFSKLTESSLWTETDVKKLINLLSHYAYDISFYSIFLNLIKILNPRANLIYSCVAGYDKFPDVVEIQHGLVVPFHAQCFFPLLDSVKEYVKNKKTIVFSVEAKKMFLSNGYTDKNTTVLPNPKVSFYFLNNIDRQFFENSKKLNLNHVVMISSLGNVPDIFKKLILDIEKNKEYLKEWDFSLVMHPSEKNTYGQMALSKVKVFENHQVSLWDMLARSLCVVVIASSVIEEAKYFGCFEVILEDEAMEDQKDYVQSLAGSYAFKNMVKPEEFIEWFFANGKSIISHRAKKLELMEKNYVNLI